ncbi:MAG: HD domain-containing protein [Clostridiales Family XIII bacterium]|jgi:putative two-component system response regulator|nr:HD domain-containing protein [Clostridiales Family XIII bacterium]
MNIRIKVIFGVMSDMIAFRDGVTGGHLDRTSKYLELLIKRMAEKGLYSHMLHRWDLDLLLCSAPLHDVGKIAISEELLNKPGKLTTDEFEVMKTHAARGVQILDRIDINCDERPQIRYARTIAGTHHEKWNGSGYPNGMYGIHIPLEGRLMAIADVYDALISNRAYKKAIAPAKAAAIIEEGSGTHFDPQLVDIFRDVSHHFEHIASRFSDNNPEACGANRKFAACGAIA